MCLANYREEGTLELARSLRDEVDIISSWCDGKSKKLLLSHIGGWSERALWNALKNQKVDKQTSLIIQAVNLANLDDKVLLYMIELIKAADTIEASLASKRQLQIQMTMVVLKIIPLYFVFT